MAGDALDFLVLRDFDSVMLSGAAIVFEGFGARGLAALRGHGEIADFHAFRRGEEIHVGGIVVERIAEATFVDDERAQARAFGFDGAGESCGAGTDADDVVGGVGMRSGHQASVRRFAPQIQSAIWWSGHRARDNGTARRATTKGE